MSEKERLALSRLNLDWDKGRTERLLGNVHVRIDRRKRVVRAAALSATLASVVCVAVVALRWNRAPTSVASSNSAPAQLASRNTMQLADGSEIQVDASTSEIRVVDETATRVRVDVARGTSRFSVVPNPVRTFEVHSGPVTVTVVGTEFIVERRGETAWVEVFRGKVRVSWGDEQVFLLAGESGTFPRANAPGTSSGSSAMHDSVSGQGVSAGQGELSGQAESAGQGESDAKTARGPHATQMYRARVARKDYGGAYAVLSRNPALAGDTVDDLLVAADVARLSHHPSEAIPYLQRIIREHPRDERAPMAAFTLGRTLGGLGRTEEAMNMFGRVQSSWPKSPLAEDALLRQAEAASQLGNLDAARRIAEQYDRDYPNGRRRTEVRRFARLP